MSSKYEQLNDKEWLLQKYVVEHRSALEIAKLIGAKNSNSVRQFLAKFAIKIRDQVEAQVSERDFEIDNDVLVGSLLGDAGLMTSNKNNRNTAPYFYKKNKYYDHVAYVAKSFYGTDFEFHIKNDGGYHKFSTAACLDFIPLYNKWYPNGKKIIPQDIEVTPMILHHWFLDDGSAYIRKRVSRQVIIILSSQCFVQKDQEMICSKMNDRFGLNFGLEKINNGTGYRIKLPQSKTDQFYQIIGRPFIDSLSYKWK
jgi:hypothetical protein